MKSNTLDEDFASMCVLVSQFTPIFVCSNLTVCMSVWIKYRFLLLMWSNTTYKYRQQMCEDVTWGPTGRNTVQSWGRCAASYIHVIVWVGVFAIWIIWCCLDNDARRGLKNNQCIHADTQLWEVDLSLTLIHLCVVWLTGIRYIFISTEKKRF